MKKMKLMALVATFLVTIFCLSSFAADIKVSGYVQVQYVNAGEEVKDISNDPIHIKRGRLKVKAKSGSSSGCVYIDGSKDNNISLKEAYVQHAFDNGIEFTMGQILLPVSYTVLRSSTKRELPERPMVTKKLYAGERDRGLTISGKLAEVSYTIGAFNGVGIKSTNGWKDDNDKKDFVVRLTGVLAGLNWGASIYSGESGTSTDKKRTGVEFQYTLPTKTELRTEYIKGKEGKTDVEGWYVLASHPLIENLTGTVRYDTYDPNKDVKDDATDTIGVALNYQLDEATKITLAYLNPKEEGTDKKNSETTLRVQFKY